MTEQKPQRRGTFEPQRSCEVDHRLANTSCTQTAKENVDGFMLCERHAIEARLEGQISCWEGILAHIDLWSREATRRNRPEIVGLLELERTRATSARQRAICDLDLLARSETSLDEASPL